MKETATVDHARTPAGGSAGPHPDARSPQGRAGWWLAVLAVGCALGCAWPVVAALVGGMAIAAMPSFSLWVMVPIVLGLGAIAGLVLLLAARRRRCECQGSCATDAHAEGERS